MHAISLEIRKSMKTLVQEVPFTVYSENLYRFHFEIHQAKSESPLAEFKSRLNAMLLFQKDSMFNAMKIPRKK